MNSDHRVLLLGATGRTGGRLLRELLDRGVAVRAIVRSARRLPEGLMGHPLLRVVEGEVLSMTSDEVRQHLDGHDTVISCLGHRLTLKGIFGPPFDVVTRAISTLSAAVRAMSSGVPVRVILMSTVAVERPGKVERARGAGQRVFMWMLRLLLPPARDNQRAAEFMVNRVGLNDAQIEWVAVRPDTLRDGPVTGYHLHEELVSSIFSPGETNMANVAHFMADLTCDDQAWARWRGRMPVIVNETATQ